MEQKTTLVQAVKEYKAGKEEAFNILYGESSKYIYTCIYKVMAGNDNAQDIIDDIMQDTYLEICKSLSQLENEERFLQWAGMIATRKCFAYIKKNKKYVLLNEEDSTFDTLADSDDIIPESVIQSKEKQRLVREIVENELTEMQKLCITAFVYNDKKVSEIAEEFGIPENTVKTHIFRAKAKIKDGVLDLEKREGTKLYSVAPFLLLLFKEDVQAATVPNSVTQSVMSSVSFGARTTTAGTIPSATTTGANVAKEAGKVAVASMKTKIIGGLIAVALLGVVGGTVYVASQDKQVEETISSEFVEETIEPVQDISVNMEQSDSMETTEQAKEDKPDFFWGEGTWQFAYHKSLMANSDRYSGFDLHDFDDDGIPELVLTDNGGFVYVRYFEDNLVLDVNAQFHAVNKETVGYGSEPSQLIDLWIETKETGQEAFSYILYDNYAFVETMGSTGFVIDGVSSYELMDAEFNTQILSYEEAYAKVQQIKEIYQKIDFKELDEEIIIEFFKAYK